jgi:hypothetical protein
MAALDFPASPSVGTIYPNPAVAGQPQYTWDGEKWTSGTGYGAIYVSDAAPAAPVGSLWWESDTGLLFVRYFDGTSTQWVNIAGGSADGGTVVYQKFVGSGTSATLFTYTPTPGMKRCVMEGWAGGAGGGGCAAPAVSTLAFGGGGGSGSYSRSAFLAADVGASRAISVGGGGAGGALGNINGSAGGNTTVTGLLSATGGTGGAGNNGTDATGGGGAGGAVGTGQFTLAGFNGAPRGSHGAIFAEAGGAAAPFGVGVGGPATATPGTGQPASGFGAGGAGAIGYNGTGAAGGTGAPGLVLITEYL